MASIAQPPVELPPRGTTRDVLTDIVNACAAKGFHDSLYLACLAAKHLPVGARVVATYRREGGVVWRHFLVRFYKRHYDLRAMCLEKLGKAVEYHLVEYPQRGERRGDVGPEDGDFSTVGFKLALFEKALYCPQQVLLELGQHVPQYSWLATWEVPSRAKSWPKSVVDSEGFLEGGGLGEEIWRSGASSNAPGWWLEGKMLERKMRAVADSQASRWPVASDQEEVEA